MQPTRSESSVDEHERRRMERLRTGRWRHRFDGVAAHKGRVRPGERLLESGREHHLRRSDEPAEGALLVSGELVDPFRDGPGSKPDISRYVFAPMGSVASGRRSQLLRSVREERVELAKAFLDAALHATCDEGVTGLEAVYQ
jgi:hypothetical protein